MSPARPYDVVRITELRQPIDFQPDGISVRAPRVGDVATIVEIYRNPPGFELECSGRDGVTTWLWAFAPQDIGFEVVE